MNKEMREQSIIVRHNVEMGHRLSQQPDSKCFQLHGHSWWVELELIGPLDDKGMVLGLDFGGVKKVWRHYLDTVYDHHLTLNENDPLIKMIASAGYAPATGHVDGGTITDQWLDAWGITTLQCDPTVENMARIWGSWAQHTFDVEKVRIKVFEAATNAATWRSYE